MQATQRYYLHNRTTIRVKGEGIFSFYIHIKEYFILSPVLSSFDRKKSYLKICRHPASGKRLKSPPKGSLRALLSLLR